MCVCVCVCVCIHICNVLSDGHFGNFLKMAPLKLFYLWTVLGLCCYLRAFFFSSCCKQVLHSSSSTQASHCGSVSFWGTWASLPCSMWNLPRPGIEPMSPGRQILNHWTTREDPGIDIFEKMLRGNQNAHHQSSDKAYQKVAFFYFPKIDFALSPVTCRC